MSGRDGSRPTWDQARDRLLLDQKGQRRKIAFVLSKNTTTSFTKSPTLSNNQVNKAMPSGSPKAQAAPPPPPENKNIGPIPGLFPPAVVDANMSWNSLRRVGPGLFNHGNTCFLNSTLQCLLHVPALTQILLRERNLIPQRSGKNNQRSVLECYQKFVDEAWAPNCPRVMSPRGMVQSIRMVSKHFRPMHQEDAHEYLRQLLDCMHEEILKSKGLKLSNGNLAETTMISRVFGGYLRNELKCQSCNYSSKTYNHFQDLSLDVYQGISSIQSAISAFIRPEKLGVGNEWKCDGCNKRVQAIKQMTISSAPNVLVLHLKRFSFGHGFGKIGKFIEYESTLDLPCSEEGKKTVRYNLAGVIVHHGSSVHSGHYIAYVKAPNGEWNEMNDTHVSHVSSKTALSAQAYVLFYVRADKSVPPPAPEPAKPKATEPAPQAQTSGSKRPIDGREDVGASVKVSKSDATRSPSGAVMNRKRSESTSSESTASITDDESHSSASSSEAGDDGAPSRPKSGRLRNRFSWIVRPFRFKGRLDPFFVRPLKIVKPLRRLVPNHPAALVHAAAEERREPQPQPVPASSAVVDSKRDVSAITNAATSERKVEPEKDIAISDSNEKRPTILRQLINLGKRGSEVGSEGFWEDAVPSETANKLEAARKKQNLMTRMLLKNRQSDQWDQHLDSGRVKKVKAKKGDADALDSETDGGDRARNPFQAFQNSWNKPK